jgi:hypothetical protein
MMSPDPTLEAEIAKAPRPLTPLERRMLDLTLERYGRIFDELRLLADAPVDEPGILPDLAVEDPLGPSLLLKPLYVSSRAADESYHVHLRLASAVDVIDQYDYDDMLLSILHQSIAILFEMECQFYQGVPGYKKEIIQKYVQIFDFDYSNYKNMNYIYEVSEKLGDIIEDIGLESLDLSWAWRYYRPGSGDEKVAHVRTWLCDCGGAATVIRQVDREAPPAVSCPACGRILARRETVH